MGCQGSYVGVDVSKERLDVAVRPSLHGTILRPTKTHFPFTIADLCWILTC